MTLCSFEQSPFGKMLIASTEGTICFATFVDDQPQSMRELKYYLMHQDWKLTEEHIHAPLIEMLSGDAKINLPVFDPVGTSFQKNVWNALMEIHSGETRTYLQIAIEMGNPSSARAVGSAIGSNPIAWFIPCHRVIQTSGGMGGYKWGLERKKQMLEWERDKFPFEKKKFTQAEFTFDNHKKS